jgi:glycosyltransferase involved in cell wall biosynthesis
MPFEPQISIITSLYRSADYLPHFLENVRAQSFFYDCELILVLNEASAKEKKLAAGFSRQYPQQVKQIHVNPVETLGASWNRAWAAALAPYLVIWNVDDRRLPDSLERQFAALHTHSKWQLCYGDYLIVPRYGDELGARRRTPRYSARFFRRALPQGGAFWMMRANLHEKLGYFDEQLRVGPDFDYSARIASRRRMRMGRIPDILGYFTDAEQGLSTREGARPSAVDRTTIQLRYGVFDKVRPEYVAETRRYRLFEILNFGEWHHLNEYVPNHSLAVFFRRPLWLLGVLRNWLRALFRRWGILEWLYDMQRRYIKREI